MAITDADRDAVVAALEARTATTDEVYVRAHALARQTDRSPKTVGTVLAALAGTEVRVSTLSHHTTSRSRCGRRTPSSPPTASWAPTWTLPQEEMEARTVTRWSTRRRPAGRQSPTTIPRSSRMAGRSCQRVPAVAAMSPTCGTPRPARVTPAANPSAPHPLATTPQRSRTPENVRTVRYLDSALDSVLIPPVPTTDVGPTLSSNTLVGDLW
jgi:hypothetical protein